MQASFVALLLAGLVIAASAHGGSFHEYPGTPTANKNVRAAIATCDDWVPAKSAISKVVTKEAALNPSNITGNGTLWVYLYKNCSDSPSIGMELDVALQGPDAATPWSGFIDGFLQTGACSTGGGDKYYINNTATPLNSSENMFFFEHYKVPANGSVRGIGSNDGDVRTSGTTAAKSYVLYNHNSTDPLFCCDLKVTDLKVTNWTAQLDGKGKDCATEAAAANITATGAGGASPAPGTASPAPRNSAAAAGASVAALLGSLVLAALL